MHSWPWRFSTNCPSIVMLMALPLSFLLIFGLAQCRYCVTIPRSLANLTSFGISPPTLAPTTSYLASIIIISGYIENNIRVNKHPCLTARLISPGSESSFSVLTTAVYCMHAIQDSVVFQSTLIFLSPWKSVLKVFKGNSQLLIKLYSTFTQQLHISLLQLLLLFHTLFSIQTAFFL